MSPGQSTQFANVNDKNLMCFLRSLRRILSVRIRLRIFTRQLERKARVRRCHRKKRNSHRLGQPHPDPRVHPVVQVVRWELRPHRQPHRRHPIHSRMQTLILSLRNQRSTTQTAIHLWAARLVSLILRTLTLRYLFFIVWFYVGYLLPAFFV